MPTDIERLEAMLADLKAGNRPRVTWMAIMFHAWGVLKAGKRG